MSALRLRVFDPSFEIPPAQPQPSSTSGGGDHHALATAGEVIREYLADLEFRANAGQVKRQHFENYRRALEAAPRDENGQARYVGFIEVVGALPIASLINHDLKVWLRKNPQWKKPDTRCNNTAAAIACFNWAEDEGFIARTPYKRTKSLKEQKVRRRDATDEEHKQIWAKANPALLRALWLVERIGLRTIEARILEFDRHILWDQSVIRFEWHEHKAGSKTKKPKILGVDGEALAELRQWSQNRRPGQKLVCLTERGAAWTKNNLDQAFSRLRDKIGLAKDLVPYCFRHRYVTQGRLSGVSAEEMRQAVDHSTIAMTDEYTHLDDKPEHIQAIAASQAANAAKIAAARAAKSKREETPLFDGAD